MVWFDGSFGRWCMEEARFCDNCVGRVFCWSEIGTSVRFGLICIGFE